MTDPVPRKPYDRPFHTVRQLADLWQCSPKTVRRIIARGELIVHKFGRQIRVSDGDRKAYERVNRHGY